MKRFSFFTILVACLVLIISPVHAANASSNIKVIVDGKEVDFGDNFLVNPGNGEVYVPAQLFNQLFGGTFKWDAQNQMFYFATEKYEKTVEDFLNKYFEAQTKYNSYSANATMSMSMEASVNNVPMSMDMQMDMLMDVVNEPLGMYIEMNMGMLGENVMSKMYLTEDGYYMYDSMSDQWTTFEDAEFDELMALSQPPVDPTAQLEIMKKFYKDVRLVETNDSYELYLTLTNDDFEKMLEEVFKLLELGPMDELLGEVNFVIEKLQIKEVIDKKTLFPKSSNYYAEMLLEVEGGTTKLVQDMEMTFTNFNSIDKIVIPQEVTDNAIVLDFDELEALEEVEEVK